MICRIRIVWIVFCFFFLVSTSAYAQIAGGRYVVDAVIQDGDSPWNVKIEFFVSDGGRVQSSKIVYPYESCRVAVKSFDQADDKIILQEKVTSSVDACSPGIYTLTINQKATSPSKLFSNIACNIGNDSYVGVIRSQSHHATVSSKAFLKSGARSWEEFAQKKDWPGLIEFYNTAKKSPHRKEALEILKTLSAEDPTGKRAYELVRRCRWQDRRDFIVSHVSKEMDFSTLLKLNDVYRNEKVIVTAIVASAMKRESPAYEYVIKKIGNDGLVGRCLLEYAQENKDIEGLRYLATTRKIWQSVRDDAYEGLYAHYKKLGEKGLHEFIGERPKPSLVARAQRDIFELHVDTILAQPRLEDAVTLAKVDPELEKDQRVEKHIVKLASLSTDYGALVNLRSNSKSYFVKKEVGLLIAAADEKRRLAGIAEAIDHRDLDKVWAFVKEASPDHRYYAKAEQVLFEEANKQNTKEGYEEFLKIASISRCRDTVVSKLYAFVPSTDEARAVFAHKYPGSQCSEKIWRELSNKACETGVFSSAIDEGKVQTFLAYSPPSEYVLPILKTFGNSLGGASMEARMDYVTQYPDSPEAVTLLQSVVDECSSSNDIGYMSWFVTTYSKLEASKALAKQLGEAVYKQIVDPMHEANAYNGFIKSFSGVVPDQLVKKAYNNALVLVKEQIDEEIDSADGDKAGLEELVRKLYSRMLRSRDEGDDLLAKQVGTVLMSNEQFFGTNAAFSLKRDREMRRFLDKRFESLISETRKSTADVIHTLKELNTSLDGSIKALKPTEMDLWRQNYQRMVQGKSFKRYHGDY